VDYYCPSCDRTFSESEAVSAPPFRTCPVCGIHAVVAPGAEEPARSPAASSLARDEAPNFEPALIGEPDVAIRPDRNA
jgi:hypothetical protein